MRSRYLSVIILMSLLLSMCPFLLHNDAEAANGSEYPKNYNIQDYEPGADEQRDLDVTQTQDGRYFAVWSDNRLQYFDIKFSKSQNGTSWGDGLFNNNDITINSDSGSGNDHWHPSITSDLQPRLYVVWLDDGGSTTRLMISTSNNSGTIWTPQRQIANVTGTISEPYIRWSPTAGLVIVYVLEHSRNGTGPVQKDIMFTRSTDGGDSFSTPVRLNDDSTDEEQVHPRIAVSKSGKVAVAWEDYRNGDSVSRRNSDIYLVLTTDGTSFSQNIRIGRPDNEQQQLPDVAFSSKGDLMVVWQESTINGWRVKYSMGWSSSALWNESMAEDHQAVEENLTRVDQFKPRVDYVDGAFVIAWTEVDIRNFYLIRTGYVSRNGEKVSGDHIVDNTIELGTFINDPDIYIAEMVKETVSVIGQGKKAQVFWLDRRTDINPSNDIAEDSDPYTATARQDPTMPLEPAPVHMTVKRAIWDEALINWEISPDIEFRGYYLTLAKGSDPQDPDININNGSRTNRLENEFTFTGLDPDSRYHAKISVADRFGNMGPATSLIINTGTNSRPTFFFVEPDGIEDSADQGFQISWESGDEEEVAEYTIHYDTDLDPQGQVFLTSGTTAVNNGFGSYYWNTSALDPGGYTLNATIDDGVNDPVTIYSPAIIVTHRTVVKDHLNIISTNVDGGRDAAYTDAEITVMFSDPVSQVSLTDETIYLLGPDNLRVQGEISMDGPDIVIFHPGEMLKFGSEYTLVLKPGIVDLEGNELDGESLGRPSGFEFSFNTISDTGEGEIRSWSPQGMGAPLRPDIKVLFDIPIASGSVTDENIKLLGPGNVVIPLELDISDDSLQLIAHPEIPLSENTEYRFNITRNVVTSKGMRVKDTPFQWSFKTGEADLTKDSDGDTVPDDRDWFPNDPTESYDNDRDSIGDNKDLDDDNDGMPDTWEMENELDPKDPDDALEDPDDDGKTNIEEFRDGTNPRSSKEDEEGIPVYFIVIAIGLLVLIILIGYAVVQRNRMEEGKAMRTYFQEE